MKRSIALVTGLALIMSASLAWAGQGKGTQSRSQKRDLLNDMDQTRIQARLHQAGLSGFSYGPGDGTGNRGLGPKDGTGYGKKAGLGNGTGTCDGTGPSGSALRKRAGNPPGR